MPLSSEHEIDSSVVLGDNHFVIFCGLSLCGAHSQSGFKPLMHRVDYCDEADRVDYCEGSEGELMETKRAVQHRVNAIYFLRSHAFSEHPPTGSGEKEEETEGSKNITRTNVEIHAFGRTALDVLWNTGVVLYSHCALNWVPVKRRFCSLTGLVQRRGIE